MNYNQRCHTYYFLQNIKINSYDGDENHIFSTNRKKTDLIVGLLLVSSHGCALTGASSEHTQIVGSV